MRNLVLAIGCAIVLPAWSQTPAAGTPLWLKTGEGRLKVTTFDKAAGDPHPALMIVLHGDLLGVRAVPPTTYHYEFARQAAQSLEGVVAAAVLRPGYRDHTGERSDGARGWTTGDNYTPEVVDAVAQVVEQLKARWRPEHTILIGHSGGAAITGGLIGRWPSLVDGAMLVSCPCDVPGWRTHMLRRQYYNPLWLLPVRSLSPMELTGHVARTTKVAVVSGSEDAVAPPEMSAQYAKALKDRGVDVKLTIAPRLGHEILLEPATWAALQQLLAVLGRHTR